MDRAADRALRWFVGLSLLAGGLVLLAGAVQFGTLGGPIWGIPLAGVVAAGLFILAGANGGGPPSPVFTPPALVLLGVFRGFLGRSRFSGSALLGGLAGDVA